MTTGNSTVGSGLSMAYTPVSKMSDQIKDRVFNRTLAHKAKLDLVKSRLTSFQAQQVSTPANP